MYTDVCMFTYLHHLRIPGEGVPELHLQLSSELDTGRLRRVGKRALEQRASPVRHGRRAALYYHLQDMKGADFHQYLRKI